MKAKKSRIRFRGRATNPEPKGVRTRKIGKKIKHPKSKNMEGFFDQESNSNIKQGISKTNTTRKKIFSAIKKKIKKLEDTTLSLDGIKKISESSINQIHSKRHELSVDLICLVGDLVESSEKISTLESKYKKL